MSRGAFLAITGSLLWGIMGVACQYLLQDKGISAIWLVNMRMFFAGIILLLADFFIYRKDFLAVWSGSKNITQMLIFSFITIMSVQLLYLLSVQNMNVAMATVFVSLAPIMTLLWVCIRARKLPKRFEAVCCTSAVLGSIIMATHGEFTSLSVSGIGILYGITLPFAGVIYTIQPAYLMKKYRPSNVTGWGLFIGGCALLPFIEPWNVPSDLDVYAWSAIIYTIVFGTAIAFWTFLASLKYLEPHIAGIYELLEPLSAIILGVWLLDVIFEVPEWIGTTLIMVPVIYLSLYRK